jgi:hypothetical protein
MLRYRLRTLLILLTLTPPVLAGMWLTVRSAFHVATPLIPKDRPPGTTGPHWLPP